MNQQKTIKSTSLIASDTQHFIKSSYKSADRCISGASGQCSNIKRAYSQHLQYKRIKDLSKLPQILLQQHDSSYLARSIALRSLLAHSAIRGSTRATLQLRSI